MQSNEDHSSNIVTADDHRNISTPDETTPLTQSGRELSSPYKYCRYFSSRCFGLIGYFLFWLTVIPLYSWKVKCAKDLTHGGQASNETSPDFYLSLPVTKLFNQSSREMFHAFDIAFKSIKHIKLLYFSVSHCGNTTVFQFLQSSEEADLYRKVLDSDTFSYA